MNTVNRPNQDQSRTISLLSFICAIFFTASMFAAHVVTNGLNPLSATLSVYALEKYGFIVELGFFSIGITQLLIAYLLFSHLGSKDLTLSAILLFLASIGVFFVAVFPTQPAPASIIDRLPHVVGAIMQFFFFPLTIFTLLRKLSANRFKTYSQLTALITAILFAVMLILFLSPTMKDFAYFGLIEKFDILVINFWLIIMSFRIYQSKTDIL